MNFKFRLFQHVAKFIFRLRSHPNTNRVGGRLADKDKPAEYLMDVTTD